MDFSSIIKAPVIDPCLLGSLCSFDKTLTSQAFLFELIYGLLSLATLFVVYKMVNRFFMRFVITFTGVLLFELFTAPMWTNSHLGKFAYIYLDISWILSLIWTALFLGVTTLVDTLLKKRKEYLRFAVYLIITTAIVFSAESVVLSVGIREYSLEVKEVLSGTSFMGTPIEALYYVSVFSLLIISFYKYMTLDYDKRPIIPSKKKSTLRIFILSLIGVFLFELMIEPMVYNRNLPSWSYFYRDISFLVSIVWVCLVTLSVLVVEDLFYTLSARWKFLLSVGLTSVVAFPLESLFMNYGIRVYGPTATQSFSGFNTVITHIPVEVAMAIPLYFALILAFVFYHDCILESRL
ncbi:MAG: hypothetical protein AAB443_03225 [Patescibacteria group bacterium]